MKKGFFMNNTAKILPYSSGSLYGVILPHSEKVLTSSDLDKKIEKTRHHIEHLNGSIASRKTHGGRHFRDRKISILTQVDIANKKLELYEKAKTLVPQAKEIPAQEDDSYSSRVISALGALAGGALSLTGRIFGR